MDYLEFSMNQSVWIALIAGFTHHFLVQYPSQATLEKTLLVFGVFNNIFCLSHLRSRDKWHPLVGEVSQLLTAMFIFNIVYVCHFPKYSNVYKISAALILKTVYNVFFRHRGIPGKFVYKATDWAFWKDSQMGDPSTAIAALHRDLGSSTKSSYLRM